MKTTHDELHFKLTMVLNYFSTYLQMERKTYAEPSHTDIRTECFMSNNF